MFLVLSSVRFRAFPSDILEFLVSVTACNDQQDLAYE
jgi:hypothetical protein